MSDAPKEKEIVFRVFWAALMERSIPEIGASALMNVAMVAGANGFTRIAVPYMRVDWARDMIVRAFLDGTTDPNDLLIMLDCDHQHPQDILVKLASHPPKMGVVGALAFRRGPPYEAMFFMRDKQGILRSPAEWEPGCYKCDAVGTGAIAIRRWVFTELDKHGYTWPHFRFEYPPESGYNKSEDIVFCENCCASGIQLYCNTSVVSPHIGTYLIDDKLWFEQNMQRANLAELNSSAPVPTQQKQVQLPQIATRVEGV